MDGEYVPDVGLLAQRLLMGLSDERFETSAWVGFRCGPAAACRGALSAQ